MDYLELSCRWIFGLQMVFWGLNGIFHWVTIPPASPKFQTFVDSCVDVAFIMPIVKTIEILFGFFLVLNFVVPLSLAVFAPIMFVIAGLHILHNPKPWAVLITILLPYLVLVFAHRDTLLRLVH